MLKIVNKQSAVLCFDFLICSQHFSFFKKKGKIKISALNMAGIVALRNAISESSRVTLRTTITALNLQTCLFHTTSKREKKTQKRGRAGGGVKGKM